MTKKQYCQTVIDKFTADRGRLPGDGDVCTSTTLAISMEVLGMLKTKAAKEYTAVRAGIKSIKDNGEVITFREYLDTLED